MAPQPLTAVSRDGTPIALWRSGKGEPLVLVHGTAADHTRWVSILSELERRFTVVAVDRRGRGGSGDTEPYALEREFEDVAAAVEAVGEPVNLLGHSYGALCALEAARLTGKVRALVLYEPPIPVGIEMYPSGLVERLETLLDRGDREAVLVTFLREVVRMPPHELEAFRASPVWPARLAAAQTLPRELRASESYTFDAERFRGLTIPILLLVGSASPPFLRQPVEMLHRMLPSAQVFELTGQQHIAMDTASELFVRALTRFVLDQSPDAEQPRH